MSIERFNECKDIIANVFRGFRPQEPVREGEENKLADLDATRLMHALLPPLKKAKFLIVREGALLDDVSWRKSIKTAYSHWRHDAEQFGEVLAQVLNENTIVTFIEQSPG